MLSELFKNKTLLCFDICTRLNPEQAKEALLTEAKAIVSEQEDVRLGILRNYSARSILG